MDPSTTRTNGSSSPRSALCHHSMKVSAPCSGPHSKSISGQCTATLGRPGRAPSTISSMLGWVAAVSATESPSQPRPPFIQRICTTGSSAAWVIAATPSLGGPHLRAPWLRSRASGRGRGADRAGLLISRRATLIALVQCVAGPSRRRAARPGRDVRDRWATRDHSRRASVSTPARCAGPLTAHHMLTIGRRMATGPSPVTNRLFLPRPDLKTEPSAGWTHMSIGSGSSPMPFSTYSHCHTR